MEQKQTAVNESDVMNLAMMAMKELEKERTLRLETETRLAEYRNKALFADAVTASRESILVADMALILKQKGVNIGRDRLFDWLRGNGYLYRKEYGHNRPTQKSLDMGIIELQETAIVNAYGKVSMRHTVKITQKGKDYFLKLIVGQKEKINAMEAARKKEQQQKSSEPPKQQQNPNSMARED